MNTTSLKFVGALLGMLTCASPLLAQNAVGQWDFDNGDLTQTLGANLGDMTYADGPTGQTAALTQFGTTTNLGIPSINGTQAFVMHFPGNSRLDVGYLMPTPDANGTGYVEGLGEVSGTLVNEYTVIMDVLYTNAGVQRPLIQMDNGALDGITALLDINANGQLEVTNTLGGSTLASGIFGSLTTNVWYRIGLAFDNAAGTATVYTNGVVLGVLNFGTGNIDTPFALIADDYLPAFSSTYTNAPGFVNSLQLRDEVLNPGQMAALGAASAAGLPVTLPPAYSYIVSRTPDVSQVAVSPEPPVAIIVDPGSTTINPATFSLSLDGTPLAITVTADPTVSTEFDINAQVTSLLVPQSSHIFQLVYTDSLLGQRTQTWSFSVANYESVNLPAPIYFENFDELSEGSLPPGWAVTNETTIQDDYYDLSDPSSDAYLSFVVINTNRFYTVGGFNETVSDYTSPGLGTYSGIRRLLEPPIVLNGQLINALGNGNVAYADSDQRDNSPAAQVDVMFTSDYDLTGKTNIYLAFNSIYEQNQDSLGSVEYSIDQGATWLPALYMLDDGTTDGGPGQSDVVTNQTTGQIDVFATFGTPRDDQAYGLAYSNFIGAVVSTNLIPYISPRRQDDPINSKRIEVIRLPFADNQSHVRFRFGQAGTSSWYFGIDNFGIYSINYPVISTQPANQSVDAGTPATFSVIASGTPLTYQWDLNGQPINGATNSTYTIPNALPANAGTYTVLIGGITASRPAVLTVATTPVITSDLSGEILDPGATLTFTGAATGGQPLAYQLLKDGTQIATSTTGSFTLNNIQAANAGNYQLQVVNAYGTVVGAQAAVRVYAGLVSSNLVVHLPFDGNLNDTSGRGNDATYMNVGANSSPTARFAPGMFGQAFEYTTTNDYSTIEYASLGYPPDLQFGATNDWSVSLWCNYTNQGDDLPFISNKDWNSSSDLGWGIFTQSGGNYRINVTGPNGGADKFSYTDTPDTLKDGKWHHILVSFQHAPYGQSAYVYGYLDGVLVSKHPMHVAGTVDTDGLALTDEQYVPSPQSQFAVNIGQDGTGVYADQGGAHNINARIDDVGIWRRALTANEDAAIYHMGLAGKDLSQVITPEQLYITVSGGNANLTWLANPAVKLQESTSLNPANWTDVANTLGAGSASVPVGNGAVFFRLSQ